MDLKKLTQDILDFWNQNNCFEQSIQTRSDKMNFRFYDGPPFASGDPHYGHLLGTTLKDLVPRYFTMRGYRVYRKWGWDCHGLPVENYIEKKLGISSKKQIDEEVGIDTFTDECRKFVLDVNDNWSRFVNNSGRWVDFQNAYFTMNTDFMESVINVFSNLYNAGYIFKGFKIQGYCPRCATTLSNHEMNEGYADKQDQALTVKFEVFNQLDQQYECTNDGFIEAVAGIIRDDEGKYFMIYHNTANYFVFPGGKVGKGETLEQALTREILEETGCDVMSSKFVGSHKRIKGNPYRLNYFEIEVSGTPKIMESDKHQDAKWIEIIPGENHLGYAVKVDNIIIDDADQIIKDFVGVNIYTLLRDGKLPKESYDTKVNFLAWTTTPWTLPANMFLAVGKDIIYSMIYHISSGEYYILADELVDKYYKDPSEYLITYRCRGIDLNLVGYKPLFDFYLRSTEIPQDYKSKAFKVLIGDFVSTTDGTGIVHIAPAFGADDYEVVCQYENFKKDNVSKWLFMPVDEYGRFTSDTDKYSGGWIFDVNKEIISDLKSSGKVVKIETLSHSYPHCRRCDTPLIYRAIDSWFVDEISNKDKIKSEAKDLHFVPESIKTRFDNILSSAPDWNISRKRYRGTPLPVWESDKDENKRIIISSQDDLYHHTQTGSADITKFMFVRHGETSYNLERKADCRGVACLNENGEKQAQELISQIKDTLGADFDKNNFVIYISPLLRTVQTINPFLQKYLGIDLLSSPEYQDIRAKYEQFLDSGKALDLDERTKHVYKFNDKIIFDFRIAEMYVPDFQDKNVKWEDISYSDEPFGPNGESVKAVENRIKHFIQDVGVINQGKTVLVVSHGDPLVLMHKSLYDFDYTQRKMYFYQKRGTLKTLYFDAKTRLGLDLHRPHVDRFWFDIDGHKYHRITDVLDCWFESGSMPYGEIHYPFDPAQTFSYPADYIAEGLDQTRGWFRSLHVLGSLLIGQKAFKNVVVNGLILAEDGKKMSKKLKNYPDPRYLFDQYGPDAFRMYVLNSPVVRAEPMRFSEKGVGGVLKDFVLPIENVYNFFETYANIDGFHTSGNNIYLLNKDFHLNKDLIEKIIRTNPHVIYGSDEILTKLNEYGYKDILSQDLKLYEDILTDNIGKNILIVADDKYFSAIWQVYYQESIKVLSQNELIKLPTYKIANELDKWILAECYKSLGELDGYMEKYYLDYATKVNLDFIDKLTNWYLRRSRRRFWEEGMSDDKLSAYNTLFEVMTMYMKMIAPFAPFISEHIWMKLSKFTDYCDKDKSVHLQYWPVFNSRYVNQTLIEEISKVREIITLALYVRAKNKIKVKQPLNDLGIMI